MTAFYILVMGFAFFLLLLEVCTTGWELLSQRLYRGSVTAVVADRVRLDQPRSKGLVEVSSDGDRFDRIKTTEDREVGYFPFQFQLFEKGRYQYVLQWTVGGKTYRGHYRHLKRKEVWKTGQRIPLRHKEGQPWKFAIDDPAVRTGFFLRVSVYVILIVVGFVCFPAA